MRDTKICVIEGATNCHKVTAEPLVAEIQLNLFERSLNNKGRNRMKNRNQADPAEAQP